MIAIFYGKTREKNVLSPEFTKQTVFFMQIAKIDSQFTIIPREQRRSASSVASFQLFSTRGLSFFHSSLSSTAMFFQFFAQGIRRERFDKIIGHARLNRFENPRFFRFRGHHDDRNLGILSTNGFEHF